MGGYESREDHETKPSKLDEWPGKYRARGRAGLIDIHGDLLGFFFFRFGNGHFQYTILEPGIDSFRINMIFKAE
jgi:hypothetical protein